MNYVTENTLVVQPQQLLARNSSLGAVGSLFERVSRKGLSHVKLGSLFAKHSVVESSGRIKRGHQRRIFRRELGVFQATRVPLHPILGDHELGMQSRVMTRRAKIVRGTPSTSSIGTWPTVKPHPALNCISVADCSFAYRRLSGVSITSRPCDLDRLGARVML